MASTHSDADLVNLAASTRNMWDAKIKNKKQDFLFFFPNIYFATEFCSIYVTLKLLSNLDNFRKICKDPISTVTFSQLFLILASSIGISVLTVKIRVCLVKYSVVHIGK